MTRDPAAILRARRALVRERVSQTLANPDVRADLSARIAELDRELRRAGRPALLLLGALAGCGVVDPPPAGDPAAIIWSDGYNDSSIQGAFDVTCGDVESHPCPRLLFETHLVLDLGALTATWSGDAHAPVTEAITLDDSGNPVLPQHGDDGGLRLLATLGPGGGDVSWDLFVVPGETTFHLTLGGSATP